MAFKKNIKSFRTFRFMSKKPGAAPGTIEHVGEKRVDNVSITIHDYDQEHVEEIAINSIEDCKPYLQNPSKTWIKVEGLHDVEKLKSIWSYFDLHPLIQEDIVNTNQRPKVEQYGNCVFIVMRLSLIHI